MNNEQRAQRRLVETVDGKRNPAALHDSLVMWGTNALGGGGFDGLPADYSVTAAKTEINCRAGSGRGYDLKTRTNILSEGR